MGGRAWWWEEKGDNWISPFQQQRNEGRLKGRGYYLYKTGQSQAQKTHIKIGEDPQAGDLVRKKGWKRRALKACSIWIYQVFERCALRPGFPPPSIPHLTFNVKTIQNRIVWALLMSRVNGCTWSFFFCAFFGKKVIAGTFAPKLNDENK